VLDCGCLVGIYETYAGQVIATIDARGAACQNPTHTLHSALSSFVDGADAAPAPAASRSNPRHF
jgi:hypothetical protein